MLPNFNFNPSFANLAALQNLGGLPHPFGGPRMWQRPMSGTPMPMPGPTPTYSALPGRISVPMQPGMGAQFPQGNLNNLQALMQILGRRQQF